MVSALLHPQRLPARVVIAAIQGRVIPLFDQRILDEYHDVLSRSKFRFERDQVALLLADLESLGESVTIANPAPDAPTPDPADRPFLEVAIAGRADALVTGNRRHFPDGLGVAILSPAELMNELEGATR
ncbi:MAG: putative toxin-antitoxin system toxin component, PIN family [Proteobacteria bacterium]|nr:putative toxin-antitoxin system toxin component, PIN family [Pseudomonadota bacterium]